MNLSKMYTKVYEKPCYVRILKLFSHFCEALFAFALGLSLLDAYRASPTLALAFLGLSFLSFVIISGVRRVVNAPRPADLFPELEFLKGRKTSPAFPSRHTFSASLIAVMTLRFSTAFGIVLLLLSLLLGASRIALGKHFPRDVVCGWLLGVLSGALVIIFSYNIIMA